MGEKRKIIMLELDKIYLGDCLNLMAEIPDGSIDMVLCDLPYGTTQCKWDVIIPFNPLWEQYKRVVKQGGAVVLFCNEPFTSKLVLSNIDYFREKLTWQKHKPSNIGNAKYMHLKYSEDIVCFSKGRCTYNPQMQRRTSERVRQGQKGNSKQWRTNRKDSQEVSFATQSTPRDWKSFDADWKYPSNVLSFPAVVSNSHEKVSHPTQKPVSLFEYLIKTYSNENEVVLDNCIGSGTTAIAAIRTRRHFIGIEKENNYYEIACNRVRKELSNPSLF